MSDYAYDEQDSLEELRDVSEHDAESNFERGKKKIQELEGIVYGGQTPEHIEKKRDDSLEKYVLRLVQIAGEHLNTAWMQAQLGQIELEDHGEYQTRLNDARSDFAEQIEG